MIIKKGVKANGVRPEILLALLIADSVYIMLGFELVVTELTGGEHRVGSLHFVGLGADIRTRYFKDGGKEAAKILRDKLGDEYDVVLHKTHIHIEYQPKV